MSLCKENDLMPTKLEQLTAKLDQLAEKKARPWPRFLSIRIAAEYSTLSEVSIRRLISAGKLTALRPCLGKGKVLIDRHQLDAVVVSATATPRKGRGIRTSSNAGN